MLYIYIPGFRQWRSRTDRNLTPNITSYLESVMAWQMGRDYSYCRASELIDRQVSGLVFFQFLENKKNRRPRKRPL